MVRLYYSCIWFKLFWGLLLRIGVDNTANLPRYGVGDSMKSFLTVWGVATVSVSLTAVVARHVWDEMKSQYAFFRRVLAAAATWRICAISALEGNFWYFLGRIKHYSESAGWGPCQLAHFGGQWRGLVGSHVVSFFIVLCGATNSTMRISCADPLIVPSKAISTLRCPRSFA